MRASALARFARAREGSTAIIAALALPVLFGAAAFGVDLGVIHIEQQALQRAVDAAALAAAAQPQTAAEAVARRVLAANGQEDADVAVRPGRYDGDADLLPENRFRLGGGETANAVSVEASRDVSLFFARIFERSTARITASARASAMPTVSFAIGSRLASVDPALLDAMLTPLLGSGLGLTVLDYRSLAAARLSLWPLLEKLALAEGLPPGALVGDVLDRPVSLSLVLGICADVLSDGGNAPAASVARKAARARASAAIRVAPGDILDGGGLRRFRLDYPSRDLAARVSVLGLLSGAIADRSIGNAVAARLVVPGVLSAGMELLLGEDMRGGRQAAIGGEGTAVRTAQVRARLAARTSNTLAALGAVLEVETELVAAGAEARVVGATCAADPAERAVTLAVGTGLLRLSLGRSHGALDALSIAGTADPAVLVSTPLLAVDGAATLRLGDVAPQLVTFRGGEIGSAVKTVRSRHVARSLLASLFLETVFFVRADPRTGIASLGEPLLPLRAALVALAGPIDDLFEAALAAAGLGLGEVDVRVDDLVCGSARLVG